MQEERPDAEEPKASSEPPPPPPPDGLNLLSFFGGFQSTIEPSADTQERANEIAERWAALRRAGMTGLEAVFAALWWSNPGSDDDA